MPPLLLLWVVLASGGCVRLVAMPAGGTEAGSTDQHGAVGDGHAVGDGPAAGDGRRDLSDGSRDRASLVEGAVPDAVEPDQQATCNEDQGLGIGPICGKQSHDPMCVAGTAPAADSDCDGLRGLADPWPATCNTLVLAEGFVDPPGPPWLVSGTVSASCGKVHLADGAQLSTPAPAPLADATYLVEMKFTLGLTVKPADWRVAIGSTIATGQYRNCEIWQNPTYQLTPGIHSNVLWSGYCDTGMWTPPGVVISGANGTEYILQSWHVGNTHHCRLLSGDSTQEIHHLSHGSCQPPLAGTLRIAVNGREATVDYLRVFDY